MRAFRTLAHGYLRKFADIRRKWLAEEAQEVHPDVDDTDGLDPEAEFEAWKLRELMRLKRDREARYAYVSLPLAPSPAA